MDSHSAKAAGMLQILRLATLDQLARKQVVLDGKLGDRENLYAYDRRTGWTVWEVSEQRNSIAVPEALARRLLDGDAELYLHHYHPDSVSFSRSDLELALSSEGRARGKLYAHGADGTVYGVMFAGRDDVRAAYGVAYEAVERALRVDVGRQAVPAEAANRHFAHILCKAFDMVGIMHYEFSLSQARLDEYAQYAEAFESAAVAAAGVLGE